MNPITRLEYYLAKIAGTWDGRAPEPITIEEYYLAIMTGDYSGNAPWPVTRLQYYMAKAAGVWSGNTPEPVTRVEQYWAAIANGGGNVPEPVTREEHLLSIIVGAHGSTVAYVSGNPIILTDAKDNAELKGLRIFGKSIQNGDPSPESPVPIVNVGDKGNIGIKIEGKNLIDIASGTKQGYNVTQPNLKLIPGQAYTFTNVDATTGVSLHEATTNTNLTKGYPAAGLSKAFVMPNIPNAVVILAGLNGDWNTGDLSKIKIQLELGDKSTPYEPYKPAQTLIVPTPGGLPGISVPSGGNYTDENGQQWVTDEADLAKGVYIKRIEKIASYNNESINGPYISETGELTVGARVLFALDASVETPLSPETIVAYKQLHTYAPTTTIINDGGAGMEVGYRKI
ncbi:putative uncharacterized protein [Clostridium sp. CAG:58]|mgnify:CR=1 FL=1|jgi:hypothetical protein|nr:putative uncharacterized protein [Clostridium sp. CAG:58]